MCMLGHFMSQLFDSLVLLLQTPEAPLCNQVRSTTLA